ADALQIRLDAVEARGGMAVSFQVEGTEALNPGVRQEMYQVATEALNNALKHARAQAVKVKLSFDQAGVSLDIADDGVGFDAEAARKGGGLGLRGMRERLDKVQGTLEITSTPGKGTRILARAPGGGAAGTTTGHCAQA
ncbi:MAG TPA: ATP-binding protein, partial [Spirochaetia bacterium]|nr:ATP-binding protein [Spirochaetia bacterium]